MFKLTTMVAALALAAGSTVESSAQPRGQTLQITPCELGIASRTLARYGVLDAAGHISMRSPTRPDRFYISRALAPGLVKTADVMEFDLQGNPVDNKAGAALLSERFIHAAVYRARPDVKAVVHSHSPESVIFSVSSVPLRAIAHTAGFVGTKAPVFDADTDGSNPHLLVSDNAIGDRLAAALGRSNMLLIRGHGDVVVGPTLPTATARAVNGRKNARMLLDAIHLGGDVKPLTVAEAAALSQTDPAHPEQEIRAWTLFVAEDAAAGGERCQK